MGEIRGLSITQPWASLIALGAKQYETRSWPTNYRGHVAIHASKAYPRDCRELEKEEPFASMLAGEPSLPIGAIIAVARLVDCVPTADIGRYEGKCVIGAMEMEFGDYAPGRYAFRMADVARIEPIPCRGALSLWALTPELLTAVRVAFMARQRRDGGPTFALPTSTPTDQSTQTNGGK
jgi:hypothetical protein